MPITPVINVTDYLFRRWTDRFRCWELVCEVYKDVFDITLADYPQSVFAAVETNNFRDAQEASPLWIARDSPESGDVVVFSSPGRWVHVGVVLDDGRVLHLPRGASARVEKLAQLSSSYKSTKFYHHAHRNHHG